MSRRVLLVVSILVLLAPVFAEPGLRREGQRLFWDDRPVQLVGYSYYGLLADRTFDVESFLKLLAAHNINFTRFFLILPWPVKPGPNVLPFARRGNRYDLHTFDEECFARLASIVERAESLGIICQICLFDRCGLSVMDRAAWTNHPYNKARNVQGFLSGEPSGYPHFCQTAGPVAEVHAAVIKKVTNILGERHNVIYEIMNEPYQQLGDLEKWHGWAASKLRAGLAGHRGSKVISSTGAYKSPAIDLFSMHMAGSRRHVDASLKQSQELAVPLILSDDGDANSMYHPEATTAAAGRALRLGQHFEHLEFTLTLQREVEGRPADRLDRISGHCRLNLRSLSTLATPILERPFVRNARLKKREDGQLELRGEIGNVAELARLEAELSTDGGLTWSTASVALSGTRALCTGFSPQDRKLCFVRFVCVCRNSTRWPGPAVPYVSSAERMVVLGEDILELGLFRIRPNVPDGCLRATRRRGKACWQVDSGRRGKYAYFRLERSLAATKLSQSVRIVVEYFDESPHTRLVLEYDSKSKPYTAAAPVLLAGSRKWKEAEFSLAAPDFRGRQNDGADFRFSLQGASAELVLRKVRIRWPQVR